jgi:hypothetical protein
MVRPASVRERLGAGRVLGASRNGIRRKFAACRKENGRFATGYVPSSGDFPSKCGSGRVRHRTPGRVRHRTPGRVRHRAPGGCGTRPRASLALRYGWRRSWHQRTVMDRVRLCPTKFCTRPKPRRLEMAVTATSPPPMAGLISISRCRRRWVATATALTRNSCSRPATLPASIARCGSSHARQASSLAARPSPPR